MPHRRLGPPPRAVALLSRRLGSCAFRESILGDLDEEHAAITRRRSRAAADLFYWWQAVRLPRDRRTASRSSSPGWHSGANHMGDIRIAIRQTFKQPAHTLLIIVALGLGLGLNAAVYGMGDALLVNPFPYPGVDRLVSIGDRRPGEFANLSEAASPANFLDWRAAAAGNAGPFDAMVAIEYWSANLTGGDQPERVQAYRVSPGFITLMGLPLTLGRDFTDEEAVEGRDRAVILGHGLWSRRFGADPGMVGRTVLIEGHAHTVVGIGPRDFNFPFGAEAWVPLAFDAEELMDRNSRYLTVIARLRDGVTLDSARAHMAVVEANLDQRHPDENAAFETSLATLAEGLGDQGSANLIMVWQLSAVLVLLIACANIASLLLARGASRAREMAVRLAIGSSRWRLVRQLMVESLVLAALAVPVSLGLAWWLIRVVRVNMPPRIALFVPGWNEMRVDADVMLVTAAAAAVTSVVFGLLPALQTSSLKLVDTLKEGGRGSTGGRMRLRRVLVTAEVALALPLLVAAGMTALGTQRFLNGPQGYDPDGLLTFRLSLPDAAYPDRVARARFAERAVEAFEALPGVTAAAATNVIPASSSGWGARYEIEGQPVANANERPRADYRTVTPAYFETMRTPITRGRAFTRLDNADAQLVAIVSDSFVERHWPGQDPLGRRILLPGDAPVTLTVVGTAGNYIHDWFLGPNVPTIYRPAAQFMTSSQGFVIRTAGDPTGLTPQVRQALAAIDPSQPIYQVSSQRQLLHERTIGPQYAAAMMALFGALALLLSVVGIYALIGYYVQQRRQEIGVRMALGASRRDIVRQMLRQAATLAAFGVVIGTAAAWALGRLLESALFGIAQSDPRLLAGFALTLTASALLAGYLPARRAAGIDPLVAMRTE